MVLPHAAPDTKVEEPHCMLVDPHTGTCRTVEVEVKVKVKVDYAAISSGFRAVTVLEVPFLNKVRIGGPEVGAGGREQSSPGISP